MWIKLCWRSALSSLSLNFSVIFPVCSRSMRIFYCLTITAGWIRCRTHRNRFAAQSAAAADQHECSWQTIAMYSSVASKYVNVFDWNFMRIWLPNSKVHCIICCLCAAEPPAYRARISCATVPHRVRVPYRYDRSSGRICRRFVSFSLHHSHRPAERLTDLNVQLLESQFVVSGPAQTIKGTRGFPAYFAVPQDLPVYPYLISRNRMSGADAKEARNCASTDHFSITLPTPIFAMLFFQHFCRL